MLLNNKTYRIYQFWLVSTMILHIIDMYMLLQNLPLPLLCTWSSNGCVSTAIDVSYSILTHMQWRERNCSCFSHLSLLFSILNGRWPSQCSSGDSLAIGKIHKSPCWAYFVEWPEWEAAQLCQHLRVALVTLGLSLMFKTTVNFLCNWQFNGDACPSDHTAR